MALRDLEEMTDSINAACTRLDSADSMLVLVESDFLHEAITKFTKCLLQRDLYGIYLCLNKPHTSIKAAFSRTSIDTRRIFFVDCVTALAHKTLTRREENVIYASGLEDLSEEGAIPSAILKFFGSISGEKFLIVDALRTLFIYNEPKIVSAFVHSLLSLTKEHDVKLIILSRKGDNSFIKLVSKAFDEVLEL